MANRVLPDGFLSLALVELVEGSLLCYSISGLVFQVEAGVFDAKGHPQAF